MGLLKMENKLKTQINKTYDDLYDLDSRFNFLNKEIGLLLDTIQGEMQQKGYKLKLNSYDKYVFVKNK